MNEVQEIMLKLEDLCIDNDLKYEMAREYPITFTFREKKAEKDSNQFKGLVKPIFDTRNGTVAIVSKNYVV